MNEREIFEAALDYTDTDERRAYLSQVCGDDAALHERIETLLASHAAASRFLNEPAVSGESTAPTLMQDLSSDPDASQDSDDELATSPDISFLSPSSKPGSIGTLGHYEILQILGQGAFGIVFKAFDEKLLRYVAIKAMNPQLAATSPPRKRFLREARSVAAVKHENIVQIHSVEEQPLPYLVMEYVEGQTLQHRLDGTGPLEVPEILYLGRQMAAGLAAAHDKGLIHRDIKPGNILIEAGAELKVKITDFGLARAADDATMTRTGMIAGTPMYMAPEQAMGLALDHRADLFSLGSVLYQMACGRPPFRGPNAIVVLKRVVDEEPRSIQEILAEVPDWLCRIIAKLHAKAPGDRYQSARELTGLLTRCQSEWQLTGTVTAVPVPEKRTEVVPESLHVAPMANREVKVPDTSITSAQRTVTVPTSQKSISSKSGASRWIIAATLILLAASLTWALGTKLYVAILNRPKVNIADLPPIEVEQRDLKDSDSSHVQKVPAKAVSDRELAEWVLSLPGNRFIVVEGMDSEIRSLESVPPGPIRLTALMIGQDSQIGKAEFAKILAATGLVQLILNKTQELTDDDLRNLAASPSAETLSLLSCDLTKCTDQVFQHLSKLHNLDKLQVTLSSTQHTDAGFRKLNLPKLSLIELANDRMTPDCFTGMAKRLPKLTQIRLYWTTPNADLTPLTQWPLTYLAVSTNAEGIATISKITSLKELDFMSTQGKYRDEDLNRLSTLKDLQSLSAGYSSITFEGVRCFEAFTKMKAVAICNTQLSDKGLENVVKANKVEHLNISGAQISDRGLALLESMPSLTYLHISQNPQLTEAAVRKLQAALPKCQIASDFPNLLTPDAPTPSEKPIDYAAERKAAERLMRLGKGRVILGNKDRQYMTELKDRLPDDPFYIMEVDLTSGEVTDDELAAFSGCQELEILKLAGPKLTTSGLAHLKPQPNLKYVSFARSQIGDAGLPWLANSPSLTDLNLLGTPITISGWQSLPPLPSLRHFYQWDQGFDDASLQRIVSQCPDLRSLHFGGSGNTVSDLTPLSQLAHFRLLAADARVLSNAAIDVLLKLPVLDELHVRPDSEGIKNLPRLASKLTKLYLRSQALEANSNTSDFWAPVTELSQLLELIIDGNIVVDGPGLQRIATMPSLRKLTVVYDTDPAKYRTITPGDVSEFRKARPDVELAIGEQVHPALADWPGKFEGGSRIAEWTGLPSGGPAPLAGAITPDMVKETQEAWAKHLGHQLEISNSTGMKFRHIPAGEAIANTGSMDRPRYVLQRVNPFYLGTTEVTVGQFKKFVEATGYVTDAERLKTGRNMQVQNDPNSNWKTPGFAIADELPVSVVSQHDAQAFCDWLNKTEPKGEDSALTAIYRLPTQSELNFSTKAGNEGQYGFTGTSEEILAHAWVSQNTAGLPTPVQPVATKKANTFGLHDVLGNVWEWTIDDSGSAPGVVGGSFYEDSLGTVNRFIPGTEWVQPNVGFRVVKQIQPSSATPKFAERPILVPRHAPLSPQTHVTRPAPIQGIRSWTVELTSTAFSTTSMAWSPKGDLIATTSEDSCVRLWDRSGQLKSVLFGQAGRSGAGQFVRFSPDGTRLAAVDMSTDSTSPNTLRIWDVSRIAPDSSEEVTTRLVAIFPIPHWGLSVAWAPNGQHIAFGGTKGLALILDVSTGQVREITTNSQASSITWSPDSRFLCLPIDGVPTVIDAANGQKLGPLAIPVLHVTAIYSTRVTWSPDGRSIASSNGKQVWICDTETRQLVRTIDTEHFAIWAIAWHKDSRLLDVSGQGGPASLSILDTTNGATVARSPGWGDLAAFVRSPDESEIAVQIGTLQFLDGKTCQIVRSGPQRARDLHLFEPIPTYLSSDGQRVKTKYTDRLEFDAESGQLVERLPAPKGRLLAIAPDETWRAHQISETEVIIEPKGFDRDSLSIRAPGYSHMWRSSPTGQYIAQAFGQDLWIWETATGKPLDKRAHPADIRGFEWSPDGQQIATAAEDRTIRIWDITANKLKAEFSKFPQDMTAGHVPTRGPAIAWTSDGRSLWIPQGGQAGLLDLSTGKVSLLEQFVHDGIVHTMTLAPDDDRMLVRGGYELTTLRDRNGAHNLLGQHLGHRPEWHPDSRRFLSGADKFGLRGFDVETRRRLGTLWPILDGNHWLCIGPTGHYRGSAGIEEHIVYVAQLDDGSEITLSPAEFATRFGWKNDPEKATLLKLSE